MIKQVIIGFTTEGSTDVRFLENVIQRSFETVALECTGVIEILPALYLEKQHGEFIKVVENYARRANECGVSVLCIHADADDIDDTNTFINKINPAFMSLNDIRDDDVCKNMVALVPIQMTEAWMLTDIELLKSEIGTNKTNNELGFDRPPESYADPKRVIENAIRVARENVPKRRRNDLNISELYSQIGQKISLDSLEGLASFQKFKGAIRDAFRKLNYLNNRGRV